MTEKCHVQATMTSAGINNEERLLGWAATKFPQLSTFTARLGPLVDLWSLAVAFFDTQLGWLNSPLPSLNSIIIGQEVASCLERLTELEKVGTCLENVMRSLEGRLTRKAQCT